MFFFKREVGDVWLILFVIGIVMVCLFVGVFVLMWMRFSDKSWLEWMLVGLIVFGVFVIWYSFVYVCGWEGVVFGMFGFNVIFGVIVGYLIDKVIWCYRKR